jgi:hypothetical protein
MHVYSCCALFLFCVPYCKEIGSQNWINQAANSKKNWRITDASRNKQFLLVTYSTKQQTLSTGRSNMTTTPGNSLTYIQTTGRGDISLLMCRQTMSHETQRSKRTSVRRGNAPPSCRFCSTRNFLHNNQSSVSILSTTHYGVLLCFKDRKVRGQQCNPGEPLGVKMETCTSEPF